MIRNGVQWLNKSKCVKSTGRYLATIQEWREIATTSLSIINYTIMNIKTKNVNYGKQLEEYTEVITYFTR
jgi:hypothetical protein